VLVTGRVEQGADGVKIRAATAEPVEDVRARTFREVVLHLDEADVVGDRMERLKAVLVAERGECAVRIVLRARGRFVATFDLGELRVAPSVALEDGVLGAVGRADVVAMA
jgi:hypothetical protein